MTNDMKNSSGKEAGCHSNCESSISWWPNHSLQIIISSCWWVKVRLNHVKVLFMNFSIQELNHCQWIDKTQREQHNEQLEMYNTFMLNMWTSYWSGHPICRLFARQKNSFKVLNIPIEIWLNCNLIKTKLYLPKLYLIQYSSYMIFFFSFH